QCKWMFYRGRQFMENKMRNITNLRVNIRKLSKNAALGFMSIIYLVGLGIALLITQLLQNSPLHPLLIAFVADIGATLFVFLVSQIVENASAYDPYWSVVPIFLVIYFWQLNPEFPLLSLRQVIVMVLVLLWTIRLTGNWISTWRGWSHEDWRYAKFRLDNPKLFWFINLTGIQMFPTIIVFMGCLSLWPIFALSQSEGTNSTFPLNWGDFFGIIITLGAISLEFFADIQIHRFAKNAKNQGKTIQTGLWRWSRHPNYLGEIAFWWGLYIFAFSTNPSFWWMILGPIMMLALFLGISIPMMEKRNLERRDQYHIYQQSTSKLFPFPKSTSQSNLT
ncbi:MAG: DUF1295 domain-containing protein, partial [Promethearchaeota archaeon]